MTIEGGFDADVARLNQKLNRFAKQIKDATPANREASIAMYGVTIRNFDRQGALFGAWTPLAESTIRQKQRIGKEQMLVRSGRLRNAFVPSYTADNAAVRNEVEYAEHHQYGTNRIPARNMLPDRKTVLDIGVKIYSRYVERQVRAANA
jgi:phage gpG-like protein